MASPAKVDRQRLERWSSPDQKPGLHDALDLAGRRLPAAISRLRADGTVDLEQAAPLPAAGAHNATGTDRSGQADRTGQTHQADRTDRTDQDQAGQILGSRFNDEVGQVAEALAVVQRAALEAAVERAEMVSGVARIFLNLARRSQILVHRQLALLNAMERREPPGRPKEIRMTQALPCPRRACAPRAGKC